VVGTGGSTDSYGVYGSAPSTTDWAVYADGNLYGAVLYTASDEKLKNNIQPLNKAMDKIMLLKPKTYQFKTEEYKGMHLPEGTQMGLIVQDVEKVFPELVKENSFPGEKDENGKIIDAPVEFKSMNYISLIPLLTKAIQEQQDIINQQNELIAKLQKDNNVTKANFENQHTINVEMNTKLNQLYKQISAIEGEKAEK
jgi:hypothetical protein